MKYRIIITIVLLLILAGLYIVFGDSSNSNSSAPVQDQGLRLN